LWLAGGWSKYYVVRERPLGFQIHSIEALKNVENEEQHLSEDGVLAESEDSRENGAETGVGTLLRASRERYGEDLQDAARMLCIRRVYLEAIEEGRFDDLPGKAYVIGFIRSYAEHLGLDSEEVVRRFKNEIAGENLTTTLDFPAPASEASLPGAAVLLVGLLVALLAYGGWYATRDSGETLAQTDKAFPENLEAKTEEQVIAQKEVEVEVEVEVETESATPAWGLAYKEKPSSTSGEAADLTNQTEKPAPEESVGEVQTIAEPVPALPQKEPEPQSSGTASDAASDAAEETPDADESAEQASLSGSRTNLGDVDEKPAAPKEPHVILLRAKENVWIQVRDDVNNKMLFTRLMRSGDSYPVPDRSGLVLLTGNAGAVEILVDGDSVPSIGEEGEVRRSVALDFKRLLDGTAVIE
jgi:cytoskeleton protein RodZ